MVILIIAVSAQDAEAQRKKKKKKRGEPETSFAMEKLWYGGSATLGFSGSGSLSVFTAGLSPMVGYKITPAISAGPRVGFLYQYVRGQASDNTIKSVGLGSYSMGLFARAKFLRSLFVHTEYSYEINTYPEIGGFSTLIVTDGKVGKFRINDFNLYGGLGYTSGFPVGYEILVIYNFMHDFENDPSLPFDLRFGINYNF